VKLMRPGFGPAADCLLHRQRDGVTAAALTAYWFLGASPALPRAGSRLITG